MCRESVKLISPWSLRLLAHTDHLHCLRTFSVIAIFVIIWSMIHFTNATQSSSACRDEAEKQLACTEKCRWSPLHWWWTCLGFHRSIIRSRAREENQHDEHISPLNITSMASLKVLRVQTWMASLVRLLSRRRRFLEEAQWQHAESGNIVNIISSLYRSLVPSCSDVDTRKQSIRRHFSIDTKSCCYSSGDYPSSFHCCQVKLMAER